MSRPSLVDRCRFSACSRLQKDSTWPPPRNATRQRGPLARLDYVQDARLQVHVLPGERCGFPRAQPEESHGEPKPLAVFAGEHLLQGLHFIGGEYPALLRPRGRGREQGKLRHVLLHDPSALCVPSARESVWRERRKVLRESPFRAMPASSASTCSDRSSGRTTGRRGARWRAISWCRLLVLGVISRFGSTSLSQCSSQAPVVGAACSMVAGTAAATRSSARACSAALFVVTRRRRHSRHLPPTGAPTHRPRAQPVAAQSKLTP
jgi:hypothetical protein